MKTEPADMQLRATRLLERWADAVEPDWQSFDDDPSLGCYGPCYPHWGVQSNWNYAAAWQEQAHRFLMNGVSIEADAHDASVVAGRPVSEWFAGANFFPHYALDHHGYLNVGYMTICLSNAAILHFDLKRTGTPMPDGLRGVWVDGSDGRRYALVANFGATGQEAQVRGETIRLSPGTATVRVSDRP